MEERKKEFFTKSQLKEREWTEAGIKKFLGESDRTEINPIFKNAAPMQLYSIERVEKLEASKEFSDWKEKSQKRRDAAQKVADLKKQETLSEFDSIKIEVPIMPHKELKKLAKKEYEERQLDRGNYDVDLSYADRDFIDRIKVNYLRHELTEYDSLLCETSGRYGKLEAKKLIRRKIFNAIADAYPNLRKECMKQLDNKENP